MILYIILIIAIVLIALLGVAATKPAIFRVERKLLINAKPEKIFPLINDFHNWESWSPYEKFDTAMKKTHSGAAHGVGAIYEWDGNNKVGAGRMENLASTPSKITIKLDFSRPFVGHNMAEFLLDPKGDATEVTWAVYGPQNFMMKFMCLFMNMDKMMGGDFAVGLQNLKSISEK